MKILINYATPEFAHSRRIQTATAYAVGGFDKVIEYSPEDLDEEFRRKNEHILKHKKGGGYWLWKPYIIKKTLAEMGGGDFLFYADAGSLFVGPIEPLIELMRQRNQDVLPFQLPHLEGHWTKRDAFILMDSDTAQYTDTKQLRASFSLWNKTTSSMKLADEWLSYAQDERIITDIPNQSDKDNYPGFQEHRHDQSIWSLLCKKHQLDGVRESTNAIVHERHIWDKKRVDPGVILLFRRQIIACFYFCSKHPMKFRLNFLVLREMHSVLGTRKFLFGFLEFFKKELKKRITSALKGSNFLKWLNRKRGR